MALALYRPLFGLSLTVLGLLLLFIAWRLRLRWLPAWLLRILFIGALLFFIFSPENGFFQDSLPSREILLVDVSDSIADDARYAVQREARLWQAQAANRLVVAFGRDVRTIPDPAVDWPEVDGRASNVSQALQTAQSLLSDTPGRIILATDGLVADEADAVTAISTIEEAGHHLDLLPLESNDDPDDIWLQDLWTPSLLWEGGTFPVLLTIYSPKAAQATVRLNVNDIQRAEQETTIESGVNYVLLTVENSNLGVLTLAAEVRVENDPRRENNRLFATAQVFASPRVLFVNDPEAANTGFVDLLRAGGISADEVTPSTLPTNLGGLQTYDVIFLNNLLAKALSTEQMLALKVFVARQGGGLVFLGGLNSYTLGGYQHSILEPLLPVKLEPPPRLERPPTTFIIIFDRSDSMDAPQPEIPAIVLAREAAMRAIEIVDRDDYIGVITYGSDVRWDVPMAPTGGGLALRKAQDAVSQVEAYGSTMMYRALSTAVEEFEARQPTETGLILLLSDGQSSDGSAADFQEMAYQAQTLGLSISTIILGDDERAAQLMATIASEATGRYHRVLNAADLPRIMIEEGQAARGDNVQEGITGLSPGDEGHPLLSGLNLAGLPVLRGYNALTSRREEGAEDILVSSAFGDPVLAGWQYGLGRVVVWTGDDGADWASSWLSWNGSVNFWAQVVRYALLNPMSEQAQVAIKTTNGQLDVAVQLRDLLNKPNNWAEPELIYADEAEAMRSFVIPQVGPGAYELQTDLPPAGSYRAIIRYKEGEIQMEAPAAFAVNYPGEWQPSEVQDSQVTLESWADLSGGQIVGLEDLSATTEVPRLPVEDAYLLRQLIGILIIYWLLEIALRRRWLPWAN